MFQENSSNRISFKLVVVIILTFILLLPTFFIMALINDRQQTRDRAINEVSSKWGNEQIVTGPLLTVPYKVKNSLTNEIAYAYFLPETLAVTGQIKPEIRHRGVYDVVLYGSDLKISGSFSSININELGLSNDQMLWPDAFVSLGVSDMRGIQKPIDFKWANGNYYFNPGLENRAVISSGLSVRVPLDNKNKYDFSLTLNLNGSKKLSFVPVGKETKVHLSSTWNQPSFIGSFLPAKYELADSGFQADWQVLNLNRNFPQSWLGAIEKIEASAFGVDLMIPVDQYQKSMRSVKYAILLIGLTFVVFFFVEMFNKRKIHPIQYMLVGAALSLFYLLLLSISEYLNFNWAYLISAIATIAMITFYSRHIFKNGKISVLQSLILAVLYGFVYIIIQLEDYALLVGSLGLFMVLAIVMYLAKKIDWYNENK